MKLRVQPSQIRLMWGREKDTRLSGEPVKTSVTCSDFVAGADCCECIRRLRYTAVCDATCDLYSCPCMSCAPRYETHFVLTCSMVQNLDVGTVCVV